MKPLVNIPGAPVKVRYQSLKFECKFFHLFVSLANEKVKYIHFQLYLFENRKCATVIGNLFTRYEA